jgi:uncharacterized protein
MKRAFLGILLLYAGSALADFQDGVDAFLRGDHAAAVAEFQSVAEQGNAAAQYNLAVFYDQGKGVVRDQARAVHWFRRAAKQGVAKAQFNLGVAYINGEGVPRDLKRAVRWFRRAARQGDADAQHSLAIRYDLGDGVPRDSGRAAYWSHRAAEQGQVQAQVNLGVSYATGDGVPRDDVRAFMWWCRAASQGDSQAAVYRDKIARGMVPQEIAAARKMAHAWHPTEEAEGHRFNALDHPPDLVTRVQKGLAGLGYFSGSINGIPCPRMRAAIRAFQRDRNLSVDGNLTHDVLIALEANQGDPVSGTVSKVSTGSGFLVSRDGHVLTNDHVVRHCKDVRLGNGAATSVVARDPRNDIALLRSTGVWPKVAAFRQGPAPRPGDDVIAVGYPMPGVLSSSPAVTVGIVSALAGPGDDRRLMQISVPVQPGNSGGPLLDRSGAVVGMIVGTLDSLKIASTAGGVFQNVNFAVDGEMVRAFLDAHGVPRDMAVPGRALSTADIAADALRYTVLVECWK